MAVVKKGEGCVNLCLRSTPAVNHETGNGMTQNRRKHRLCSKRGGFMLSHWKCVGRDNPGCPGFMPSPPASVGRE